MAQVSPQPETSSAGANPPVAKSPPPNCAICLGNCKNICYSDSCMHQFCYKCLLEWSKIKPLCPLCKQPFKSIIHSIKDNNEYEEYFIRQENEDEDRFHFYLPTAIPPSRHFQFRTTFTVDPRGELAIQQLLSTHPLTTSFYEYLGTRYLNTSRRRSRSQRDVSSTNYRRSIYATDMWANAPQDISGQFRDISPQYYRENPAARNRLVPWLNRELNALLYENTQHVMHVVDVILGALLEHHIRSRMFRQVLNEYLTDNTDHFIHEFYSFMRSLFDMISYDRQVFYTGQMPVVPVELSSSEDNSEPDISVTLTGNRNANRNLLNRPILEVIEINSDSSRDSDVIIREPTPPVVVDLLNTDSSDNSVIISPQQLESIEAPAAMPPLLPLKIRLKHKRRCRTSTTRISSSSESSHSNASTQTHKKHNKRKRKHKKYKIARASSGSDNEPLLTRQKRLQQAAYESTQMSQSTHLSHRRKRNKSKIRKTYQIVREMKEETPEVDFNERFTPHFTPPPNTTKPPSPPPPPFQTNCNGDEAMSQYEMTTNGQINEIVNDPGPSQPNINFKIIKKEPNMWYSRPCIFNSDSSD